MGSFPRIPFPQSLEPRVVTLCRCPACRAARSSRVRDRVSLRGCQGWRAHGTILRIALTAATIVWGGAAECVPGDAGARARRIGELEVYLSQKEKELTRLAADHKNRLRTADALAKKVEKQKESPSRNWFEQRALEKNLARLRPRLEEIDEVGRKRKAVRDEAFAAAAALVSELESALEAKLNRLRETENAKGRGVLIDEVQKLDGERRRYQKKMNTLMPTIPLPVVLPAAVSRSSEMAEDECGAYAAAIARLQAEREDLLKERRLRTSLTETLANGQAGKDDDVFARIESSLADIGRKLVRYRERLDHHCPQAGVEN